MASTDELQHSSLYCYNNSTTNKSSYNNSTTINSSYNNSTTTTSSYNNSNTTNSSYNNSTTNNSITNNSSYTLPSTTPSPTTLPSTTTPSPTTPSPTTLPSITPSPTTPSPTTLPSTTPLPTTLLRTTPPPTTLPSTTPSPTTLLRTTPSPTTLPTTTPSPTTLLTTTPSPTTPSPTTTSPTILTTTTTTSPTTPPILFEYIIVVELNTTDLTLINQLSTILRSIRYPFILNNTQILDVNISTVCSPSSTGYQCRCEDQYLWSCDQCLQYTSCDNITGDTCGCINAIPPDGQYCQPSGQNNIPACIAITTPPPTTPFITTPTPTNDSHIYMPLKINDPNPQHRPSDCLQDIRAWMALNFLKFNEKKTEVIIFGPSGCPNAPPVLDSLVPYVKLIVTNLDVRIYRDFKLDKQINSVVKSSFFQLRLSAKLVQNAAARLHQV
ncbi:mucin-2-like [Gymnodraco acuticeps]|uniref:Mucin-2-like n=1 Tax=Gymnodraco acuticeps TaxID=8218 RepID=A0A6P8SMZ8_GYMAC|nr:mucin-2-like [Gymnodraco acuticeps]